MRNRVNEWRMINPKDNDGAFPTKTSFCQTLNSGLLLLQYMVPVLISAVCNVYNQFTWQLYTARSSDDNAQYSSKITRWQNSKIYSVYIATWGGCDIMTSLVRRSYIEDDMVVEDWVKRWWQADFMTGWQDDKETINRRWQGDFTTGWQDD